MTRRLTLRRGTYADSVTLMQVSRRVADLAGVRAALVAMATDLNLDLAGSMGFAVPDGVSPNELMVAVDAEDEAAHEAAIAELEAALAASTAPPAGGFGAAPAPVTVGAAARAVAASGTGVALISTPGRYAFADAVDAVDAGLHTMVFSDNVPVELEVALKAYAGDAGVLVMGPDCGTAVLGGVGLGFANVVRPGPVGIVAASGTGAQHLMTLLDGSGIGVSHCLGVGGRDLSSAVGGASTLAALDLLAADDATEVVVVVSKPPAEEVAHTVEQRARDLGKPVLLALLGAGRPDLTAVARRVVEQLDRPWNETELRPGAVDTARAGGDLRGLFAGGTLCDEAMLVAGEALGPIRSNIPLHPDLALADDLESEGHTMIDFGDDRLTRGRPHPMIDSGPRVERLRAETADPTCGLILLDVVLGLAAAADPAAELAPAIAEATAAGVPVVVSLVATRDDPQGREAQAKVLHEAGAWVLSSNAEAARTAVALLANQGDPR